MENGAVSLMKFLVRGRTGGRPSPRARECAQSTGFETLLITAKCSGRVAEATCDIVLIRVSRLEKLNHSVGFGRTILNRVMGEDDYHGRRALVGLARSQRKRDIRARTVTAFQQACLPQEWQTLTLSKLRHRLFWLPGQLTRPQHRPTLRLANSPLIATRGEKILHRVQRLKPLEG